MRFRRRYAFAVLILLPVEVVFANVVLEVSGGPIRAKEEQSQNGRTFYSFKGIPFARPPVNEMRFKRPNSSVSWDDVLDAIDIVPHCTQTGLGYNEGYEDCLYLSVYTPKDALDENTGAEMLYPVLVWLHGGNFITGMSELYKPHLIMDRDIILVVPQYRLGVLGFLTYHSPEIHGNYGMYDQLEALRWVRENIAKFGGDPHQVTLGGDCAGSASAIYHMISPLSKGLFHRVLGLSGSPLNPWALQPEHTRFTQMFSDYFGCDTFNQDHYIKCMQTIPVQELIDGTALYLEIYDVLVGNNKMAPTSANPEGVYDEIENFLPEHPLKALVEGSFTKVPVLLGITEHVGDYLVDSNYYYFLKYQQRERPIYFDKFTYKTLGHNGIFLATDEDQESIMDYYLPYWDEHDIESSLLDLGKLFGDMQYTAGILGTAELLSKHVAVNLLRFGFEGGPKLFNMRHNASLNTPPMEARVSHGDELYFLLHNTKHDHLTPKEAEVVDSMLDIVQNFCYGRQSLPDWPAFTSAGTETTSVQPDGSLTLNGSFADATRTKWLRFILKEQNKRIASQMAENSMAVEQWRHDEL